MTGGARTADGAGRRRVAAIAIVTAVLTGVTSAGIGASGLDLYLAGAYVAATMVALVLPATLVLQVVFGQALAGGILLMQSGPDRLLALPILVGVIATAELIGMAARLDSPLARAPGGELRRVGRAVLSGGAVFTAVALLGGLPGPTGLAALALAAGACVVIAVLLVRSGSAPILVLALAFVLGSGSLAPDPAAAQQAADTVLVLGQAERELTGDDAPEQLRIVARGESIDSLDATFSIASAGRVIFEAPLAPLTRTRGFDAGRRPLTPAEHRARLDEFGDWFLGEDNFMRPEEFIEEWRSAGPRHVERIPQVIARERYFRMRMDSLISAGHSRAEAERRAPPPFGVPLDTASAAEIWQEIQDAGITIIRFSPGGDRIRAIAWSPRERRFYDLIDCC